MDAIAVVLVGIGAYLMYYAVRGAAGSHTTPVVHAKASLSKVAGGG